MERPLPSSYPRGKPGAERWHVIDRNLVEPCPETPFHPGHEPPDERLQIIILGNVLGRDDEPEPVAVALGARSRRAAAVSDAP